ncbi:MAG: hypothetical protein ACODAE_01230 [Gemmatimonadota bacterium]
MRLRPSPVLVLGTLLAGCAALQGIGRDGAARAEIASGLDAAADGEYERARERLAAVALASPDADVPSQLELAFAAIDLDPRNPDRSATDGVVRLARMLLSERTRGDPSRPVAATLYLLALEAGAPDYRPGTGAATLPRLPHRSVAGRLLRARQERDSLRRELRSVEASLAERTRALAGARRELARIRDLLKR